MKLSLDLRTSLTQTLTPQQIQYLKLLQLPALQLEHNIRQEIEQNPMLEEEIESDQGIETEIHDARGVPEDMDEDNQKEIPDDRDPFEFHKMLWQDDGRGSDAGYSPGTTSGTDDNNDNYQIKDSVSFIEELTAQLRMIDLTAEEFFLGEQIIGNIDSDGYLRRTLDEIVNETNKLIAEINYQVSISNYKNSQKANNNPARQFAVSEESNKLLSKIYSDNPEILNSLVHLAEDAASRYSEKNGDNKLQKVNNEDAEKVLEIIRNLDPPGVGSRNIQECLLAQINSKIDNNEIIDLSRKIISEYYDAFIKKHFSEITKQLGIPNEKLKRVIDFIRTLNPRPGGGDFSSEVNTVTPDFMIENDDDNNDLIININDARLPKLKLSKAYEKLKKEAQYKLSNKETKEWIRNKFEDAKFLIQAVRQRKSTMLKVMTAIAHLQKDFFFDGPNTLKPLIYKNVAEKTGLDISTVCRIVNGKYAQTRYGTFQLKYFFSEALPTDDGEEVSTRIIKNELKKIIDEESKKKPCSDEKLSKLLKEKGYQVARRTVAKYREQLKIPVARLRKEI